MRGALRNFSLYARNLHPSRYLDHVPLISNGYINHCCASDIFEDGPMLKILSSRMRFFSSENGTPDLDSKLESESSVALPEEKKAEVAEIEDVNNKGAIAE